MGPSIQADALAQFLSRRFMMLLPSLSVFRRSALAANKRPWPEVIAADLTMFVDVVVAGWQVYYLDSPLVLYRGHSGQIGMDTVAHRYALVTVWESYEFRTREHELLRRKRRATALLARAGALVRGGRQSEAGSDLVRAAKLWHGVLGPMWLAIGAISLLPHLGPIFERA